MSTAGITERISERSPSLKARIAGVFYLLCFVTGLSALFVRGRLGPVAGLTADACYVAVTLLFYCIFKPVSRRLSLLAAVISLVGCAMGPLSMLLHAASPINPLVVFGFYCLLIGYLIFRSNFLPRILGVLMAIAGLGWLTFLWPSLTAHLTPYVFAPGFLGEGALTLWLLAMGVNTGRWNEQSGVIGRRV